MSDERSFKENLDLLIKLFKKLKHRTDLDDIPGIDKNMYQNFDMFLSNYENMRDQISDELLAQFGEPMKKMIADLVEQLKNEVGDDFSEEEDIVEDSQEIKEERIETKDIAEIDALLKNPNLSPAEIDRLLDERMKLKEQSSGKEEDSI